MRHDEQIRTCASILNVFKEHDNPSLYLIQKLTSKKHGVIIFNLRMMRQMGIVKIERRNHHYYFILLEESSKALLKIKKQIHFNKMEAIKKQKTTTQMLRKFSKAINKTQIGEKTKMEKESLKGRVISFTLKEVVSDERREELTRYIKTYLKKEGVYEERISAHKIKSKMDSLSPEQQAQVKHLLGL